MSTGTTVFPGSLDSNTVRTGGSSGDEITSTDHNDHSVQIEAIETALGAALLKIYPVGSIYTNASVSTNPGTLLGFGTWTAFGTGRVLVGIDSGQTEFDSLGETGGEKTHVLTTAELASHTHVQDSHNHTQDSHTHTIPVWLGSGGGGGTTRSYAPDGGTSSTNTSGSTTATNQATTATNQSAGSGTAHNNLQPYITVYMWKRTV